MSVPVRELDEAAVDRITRRLAAAAEPPWLHTEVARRLAERLPVIRLQPRSVLEWSGFLGAGEALLSTAYPGAQRWVVEPRAELLARSSRLRHSAWWTPARWRQGPAQVVTPDAVPEGACQMLWSNMALHGEVDPPAVMAQWQRALSVDGFLMFATLGPGTLLELQSVYADLGAGPPQAPLVDMHDLGDMLVQAGFADPVMDQETLTLQWASADALLGELRGFGGNAHPRRFPGMRTPRWRRRLLRALEQRADTQGRISLSVEVVYGHAFKPTPRLRMQPETAVSLGDMRAMVRAGRTKGG